MISLVGLGNPGPRYEATRHNVGFLVVERVASSWGAPPFRAKFSSRCSLGEVSGVQVLFLLPQTFMNASGDSVQPALAFHRLTPAELIVVHDELDLPFGEVRLKVGGGHAGHNGLRSITQRLGSDAYARVRVGIGRPPPSFSGAVADFVLGTPPPEERARLPEVIARAAEAAEFAIRHGVERAMNEVNRKKA
ncbi:MAG: aminoacyl-tRNA hydrolase [Polyangiaceae bacterium]|nr:aminoacyl-tRNA hydrolase [Polyangiaceae bacterium]